MSNGGKHSCWLLLSGVGELEWVKSRGKTCERKKKNPTVRAFDVTSVSVLECFSWSGIVCFHAPRVEVDLVVSAQSEVRRGRRLVTLRREDY